MNTNVELPEDHKQVCVWPGTILKEDDIPVFEEWFLNQFSTRVKYLETIITNPDSTGPGGRCDVFFSLHNEDIEKFIGPKMQIRARWVEDVLSDINRNQHLYPERVMEYMCWNPNNDTEEEEANTYSLCDSCSSGDKH